MSCRRCFRLERVGGRMIDVVQDDSSDLGFVAYIIGKD